MCPYSYKKSVMTGMVCKEARKRDRESRMHTKLKLLFEMMKLLPPTITRTQCLKKCFPGKIKVSITLIALSPKPCPHFLQRQTQQGAR